MNERYEEIKEELVEINRLRQNILRQRKRFNKQMRILEKRAKELDLEITELKHK